MAKGFNPQFAEKGYAQRVLDFLKRENAQDPSYFFTTTCLMNQTMDDAEREAFRKRDIRNVSGVLRRQFEEALEPLVNDGVLEKAVVVSQSFNRWAKRESFEQEFGQHVQQNMYRLIRGEYSETYRTIMRGKSLDSSEL